MRWVNSIVFLVAAFGAVGCNARVYSPPVRMPSLDTAATVGEGRTGVQAGGGYHVEVLGAEVAAGGARVRHGLSPETDVVVEGAALVVLNDDGEGGDNPSPVGGVLYGGLKHALADWVALTGGVGGGLHAFGGLLGAQGGAVIAWENPYVVPFGSLELGVSVPVAARARLLTYGGDDGELGERHRPDLTGYLVFTTGLRIPVDLGEGGALQRINFLGGLSITSLTSDRSHFESVDSTGTRAVPDGKQGTGLAGGSVAVELVF